MRTISFLFFLLVLVSCESKRELVRTKGLKNISSKRIIKKHNATMFSANSLDSKLKVSYSVKNKGKSTRVNLKVTLRIFKDSIIWIKGSKLINVFRAKITPSSFSYYSPINKRYFKGDFSLLEKMLGTKVTFKQLQNLLIGESILDVTKAKYFSEVSEGLYKLIPKDQSDLYKLSLFFNPVNFSLNKQVLNSNVDSKILQIQYGNYQKIKEQLIPKKIVIKALENKDNFTVIGIEFKSLVLNKQISIPFRIPSGYKSIKF